jgi:hypothetical protein
MIDVRIVPYNGKPLIVPTNGEPGMFITGFIQEGFRRESTVRHILWNDAVRSFEPIDGGNDFIVK